MIELSPEEVRNVVKQFWGHYGNKGDEYKALIHDDIEIVMPEADFGNPLGRPIKGKQAFLGVMEADYDAVPDFNMNIKRILVDGQTAIVECIQEGKDMIGFVKAFGGNADNLPADGVKIRSAFVFELKDGKIYKTFAYYDLFNFMVVQLGLDVNQVMMLKAGTDAFA
jgi:ketosteroid isomerase-like protein